MRKREKEQLDNFIPLFAEAHDAVLQGLKKGDIEPVLQLLSDCQSCAISMGTMIEEFEGEGHPTVSLLEEYCEYVYGLYQKLICMSEQTNDEKDSVDYNQFQKDFTDYILRLKESLAKYIKIKKEVVFCPYNSSMWDSLESVYLAAKEDVNTDVYVVPIPYYDKDSEGNFKTMHYEGDKFPKDVTITHYNDYNFESRHPDVIFIHNPYDGSNYVTSVHPFFYSKNLKQYTDNLVYIPYFVLNEINPDNVAGVENFVTVPAVIHAHTVIVQSEAMRQAYINVMVREAGEKTRFYWEKKILGLGSPKFDKAFIARSKKVEVPEDWESVINKSDGTRKKIIFYNTSVVALLTHREKMVGKIKRTIETFRENKDEVALIWRPHPLLRATIEAMRKELLEEFDRIVDAYIGEGWGIYDTTPNLDLAMHLADAYYGDPSSVVQLCEEIGIPVMIQNPEV